MITDELLETIKNRADTISNTTLKDLFSAVPEIYDTLAQQRDAATTDEEKHTLQREMDYYQQIVTGKSKYSYLQALSREIEELDINSDTVPTIWGILNSFKDSNMLSKLSGAVLRSKMGTGGGGTEYLVKGAKLHCSMGSKSSDLKVKSHGVYITGSEAANKKDSKSDDNIEPFGTCTAQQGKECKPKIAGDWQKPHSKTRLGTKDLDDSITMSSFLTCSKGGIITPQKSGQDFSYSGSAKETQYEIADPGIPSWSYIHLPSEADKQADDDATDDTEGEWVEKAQPDTRQDTLTAWADDWAGEPYKAAFMQQLFPLLLAQEKATDVPADFMLAQLADASDYGQAVPVNPATGVSSYNEMLYEGVGPAGSLTAVGGEETVAYKLYHSLEEFLSEYAAGLKAQYSALVAENTTDAWAAAAAQGDTAQAKRWTDLAKIWKVYRD